MDLGTDLLQSLTSQSSEMRAERERIETLDKEHKQRKDAHSSRQESWEEELKGLTERVRAGELSTGSVVQDYALATYNFYAHEDFSTKLQETVGGVASLLTQLSEKRTLWLYKQEWNSASPRSDVYGLFFLNKNPYTMTSKVMRIFADSSFSIQIEPVFSEKIYWAFFKQGSEGELVVYPKLPDRTLVSEPNFSSSNLETSSLERVLQKNPVALAGLRERLGLEISPDLQEQLKKYTLTAAATAMKVLEEQYHRVRKNDKRIQEIEAEYNSPQKVTDMFATRPVIPDAEPDPVMAAIMSYETRQDRDWSLRRLATIINDLDRTGLSSYTEPIEIAIRPGEKKVYNLAEYSRYVRGILEVGHKKREKSAA